MKLAFIGGGNLAAALIGGLRNKGFAAQDIQVAETGAERRDWLVREFGVVCVDEAARLAPSDVLVLAVKPQQLREVLQGLPKPAERQLILSVAAGIRAADIARWLGGHGAVVRAMPNTPALVGAGVTGLFALPGVTDAQRQQATEIMEAVGVAAWVETEALIDAVTAVSGSGPAYVFYFIEALEAAAVDLGLAPVTARQLVLHTFFGAASLAMQDTASPAELRNRVTSKGGTTERGLAALEAGGVRRAIAEAARAAAERAREMGDVFGAQP